MTLSGADWLLNPRIFAPKKPGMSSEVLGRDIEEVREKVERMASEKRAKENEGVRGAKEGVVKCYQ